MINYGTVVNGDIYFATQLFKDGWDKATTVEKEAALNMGTQMIDTLNFSGIRAETTQAHQFPRGTDTVVPVDIEEANYEIANSLLEGYDPEFEFENTNLRERRYATAKSTYETSAPLPHIIAGIPSSRAWRRLLPYLRDPNGLTISRVS